MIPVYKQILDKFHKEYINYFVYSNECILLCLAPGLISPFFYSQIFKKTPPNERANMGSTVNLLI